MEKKIDAETILPSLLQAVIRKNNTYAVVVAILSHSKTSGRLSDVIQGQKLKPTIMVTILVSE